MPETHRAGLFVAVVGPSGAGKDTVLDGAKRALGPHSAVRFARRVVTRPAQAGAEDHDSLDEAGFAAAEAAGAFALTWRAHGLAYGIPATCRDELAAGLTVVANLSRRALGDAARAFGPIEIVEISAEPRLLAERIAARGRESAAEVAARLARQVPVEPPDGFCRVTRIDNSGAVAEAVGRFLACLERAAEPRPATIL
ncbi:ribose 1,5-bisphosphate phosphokinase PhnN [Aureimonas endophytica]|uniref:Ribose 1,5-bisphosphate phosphokinase PhnN n=1 Tax=Aureimonas endophytica TaxID=2027858 RepID=A0A916ZI60_9HYPH|nr:phosphonate metabolism protein/1,5-bisphosphokinase (PRPP-forming) PhnN [Aureimonas endophytica]GGD97695.1 ribose 1,5-bisphosphate phosphokinase PhnN [Aureimonas endophytica]